MSGIECNLLHYLCRSTSLSRPQKREKLLGSLFGITKVTLWYIESFGYICSRFAQSLSRHNPLGAARYIAFGSTKY